MLETMNTSDSLRDPSSLPRRGAAFADKADSSALGTDGIPGCPVGVLHQSHFVPAKFTAKSTKVKTNDQGTTYRVKVYRIPGVRWQKRC